MPTLEQVNERLARYAKILEICRMKQERKTVMEGMQEAAMQKQQLLEEYENGVYP